MLELLNDSQTWLAFFTLTALELVLGIDNIIFISILANKLPAAQQNLARRIGLFLAMFMRIGLLVILAWLVGLTKPLITLAGISFSGRDLILILGGLFLLWKSVTEIQESLEGAKGHTSKEIKAVFGIIVMQIVIIDIVFSLDSIITAVGMVEHVSIMIAAVITSVILMMLFSAAIGRFIAAHPSIKILALAFLLTIGVLLIAEGFGHSVPKGYIYSAMAFSVVVEMLNIRMRAHASRPVELTSSYTVDPVKHPKKNARKTKE